MGTAGMPSRVYPMPADVGRRALADPALWGRGWLPSPALPSTLVLPGPPTIYQTLLDHPARPDYDLSSLRFAVTGAATIPVVLIERMQSELDFDIVLTAYGLTEATGFGTMCRADDNPVTVATTCGRPSCSSASPNRK